MSVNAVYSQPKAATGVDGDTGASGQRRPRGSKDVERGND